MHSRFVVAIDGPAGSGKSTIAKMAAHSLGFRYVDTGAMYRAVTWKALEEEADMSSPAAIIKIARRLKIRFVPREETVHVYADGRDVTHLIRTERVSRATSLVAPVPGVRKILVSRQRAMGRRGRVVMEGRDIGTAVFPKADVKFYLDASPEERARRRYKQLAARGRRASLKSIVNAIKRRDHKDKNRRVSPLMPAPDAVVLDTTKLSQHEVVRVILGVIKSKAP